MKKLLIMCLSLVLILTLTLSVSADSYTHDGIEYDRIYKDQDGTWHGVINVDNTYTKTIKVGTSTEINAMYFDLTRDTEDLFDVKIRFETINDTWWDPFDIFTNIKKYELEVDTTYKSTNLLSWDMLGNFKEYGCALWKNVDEVTKGTWSNGNVPQYVLLTSPEKRIDNILHFQFDYILTDYEVDSVNEDIQTQFDEEKTAIIGDDSITDEEKYIAITDLEEEYEDYVIDYGERLNYIADDDDLARLNAMLNVYESAFDRFLDKGVRAIKLLFVLFCLFLLSKLLYKFAAPFLEGAGKFLGRISGLIIVTGLIEYMGWFSFGYIKIINEVKSIVLLSGNLFLDLFNSIKDLV